MSGFGQLRRFSLCGEIYRKNNEMPNGIGEKMPGGSRLFACIQP